MKSLSRHSLTIGLALAIILDTAGQLLWKFSVTSLPQVTGLRQIMAAVLHEPLFLLLAGIFLCQLFNWLKVLENAELSYVQPITSLSYVTVCVLSAVWLHEQISAVKMVGVLCVLYGVWMVSLSKPSAQAGGNTRS